MSARRSKPKPGPGASASGSGPAYRAGWWLFLGIVALCPIAIGAVPPSFGQFAAVRFFDPFDLPKVLILYALSGLSLAAFSLAALRKEAEPRWEPTLRVLLGIAAWGGVSTVFSASPAHSIWGSAERYDGLLALFFVSLLAFLAVQYVRDARALRAVAIAAVASACIVAAYAALQYLGVDPWGWQNEAGRIASSFGNADVLGTYLLFPLMLGVALAVDQQRGVNRFVAWFAVALIGFALYATQTRGAWIGALAAGLAFAYAGWRQTWKVSRGRLAVCAAAGTGALVALAAAIVAIRPRHAASSAFGDVLNALSNGRSVIWATGLKAWLLDPILGWGPDTFARAFGRVAGADWFALTQGVQGVDNAHNFLIQRLVTLGLPGLVLTVWVIVQALVRSHRTLAEQDAEERILLAAVWAAVVGLSVALFFGVTVTIVVMWLWLAVGMLLAASARPMGEPRGRPLWIALAALGLIAAFACAPWLVADVTLGNATTMPPGASQVDAMARASALNPLADSYRWQAAEATLNAALALQQAGGAPAQVDAGVATAIEQYQAAASADRGDYLVRLALANVLTSYAQRHPGTGAAQQAVSTAEQAEALAPDNPATLVALAKAYQVAGRARDAAAAAKRARGIAPEYAAQYLGSLGQ